MLKGNVTVDPARADSGSDAQDVHLELGGLRRSDRRRRRSARRGRWLDSRMGLTASIQKRRLPGPGDGNSNQATPPDDGPSFARRLAAPPGRPSKPHSRSRWWRCPPRATSPGSCSPRLAGWWRLWRSDAEEREGRRGRTGCQRPSASATSAMSATPVSAIGGVGRGDGGSSSGGMGTLRIVLEGEDRLPWVQGLKRGGVGAILGSEALQRLALVHGHGVEGLAPGHALKGARYGLPDRALASIARATSTCVPSVGTSKSMES